MSPGNNTEVQTRAVVRRVDVLSALQRRLAAGENASAAVAAVLTAFGIETPTPALADAICRATGRRFMLAATDGFYHDGRTKEEDAAAAETTRRQFTLYEALEGLAGIEDESALVALIDPTSSYRVRRDLAPALAKLTRFAQLWEEKERGDAGA